MIGKKINQLATELAPVSTDLTIIGDPVSGVSKKITLAQLGAIFSGAVSFYDDLASFPATGDINVIYCAKDTQKLYLWSGSAYVEVFPSQALLDTYQLRSEKGNANGYASLDSSGKVPISQLPSSIMEYKGTWSASTNTPTLANGTGDTGDVYICNSPGSVNFGAGAITFAVGDYVIYSGSIWQRSSGAVGTVTSVAASITGNAIGITGSPVTTSGTLALAFAGTSAQYINGAGSLTTFPTSLISGTGNVNAIPKFTANTVLGNSVMEDDGNFVSMRGLKLNTIGGTGNTINFQQGSGIIAAGLGYSSIGAAGSTGIQFYLDQNVTERIFVLDTTTITSNTARTYSMPNSNGTLALTSDIPSLTGYVPYTGATTNVNLGTHSLSAYDLIIDHTSGSGVAASITKGGNGEALTVVKSSGSGNAASITGGVTLLSELHLTTDLADAYIASATNWNTAYNSRIASVVGPITFSLNTLGITQATGSTNGYLSSADWTTFNNKQSALTNPVTGTGTTNYLPKFTGTSTIGDSAITDDGTTVSLLSRALSGTSANFGGLLTINVPTDNTTVAILHSGGGTANRGLKISTFVATNDNAGVTLDAQTSTGVLAFATAGTERMRLNASGNLGLGVTPSAWDSIYFKPFEIGNSSSRMFVVGRSDSEISAQIGLNAYYQSGWKYTNTGAASMIYFEGAKMVFRNSASGTGGNALSWTDAMTLNASGNLSIGNTNDTYKLDVSGTGRFTGQLHLPNNSTGTNAGLFFDYNVNAASRSWCIVSDYDVYGDFQIKQSTTQTGTTFAKILGFSPTGAATFSGNITGQNGIYQSNAADAIASNRYDTYNGGATEMEFNYPASGAVVWKNGSERMRLNASGELCVGRTSAYGAGFLVNVEGNIYASAAIVAGSSVTATSVIRALGGNIDGTLGDCIYFENSGYPNTQKNRIRSSNSATNTGNLLTFETSNGTVGSYNNNQLVLRGDGNVGIGTTSPSDYLGSYFGLAMYNASNSVLSIATGSTGQSSIYFSNGTGGNRYNGYIEYMHPSNAMTFATAQTERARITSGGVVCINQTSAVGAESLEITSKISGGAQYGILVSGNPASYTNYAMRFVYTGVAVVGSITFNTTSTSYNTSSDYRLKTDYKDFSGLDLVSKIKAYDYEWKSDKSRSYGVIAHELQSVINYAVTGVKDGEQMQGVDYSKIVPVLIKAIQELNDKIK